MDAEEAAEKAEQIAAILAVTGQLTDVKTREGEQRLLGDLVESSSLSTAEKDELVSKLLEQQRQADEQQNAKKDYANASLHAKLEARRRLRQEKAKEDALRKEMDSLSENRVSVNKYYSCVFVLPWKLLWKFDFAKSQKFLPLRYGKG